MQVVLTVWNQAKKHSKRNFFFVITGILTNKKKIIKYVINSQLSEKWYDKFCQVHIRSL